MFLFFLTFLVHVVCTSFTVTIIAPGKQVLPQFNDWNIIGSKNFMRISYVTKCSTLSLDDATQEISSVEYVSYCSCLDLPFARNVYF